MGACKGRGRDREARAKDLTMNPVTTLMASQGRVGKTRRTGFERIPGPVATQSPHALPLG
jgi:hypothetical protein